MIMKRIAFILAFFPGVFLSSHAQVFEVDTIQYYGEIQNRINLVILGDGYQIHELDKYINDANDFSETFFSVSPYKEYRSFFNVFAIKVPSEESGASHPGTAPDVTEPEHPIIEVDNYFGSTFDSYDIHRLLVPANTAAITNVLANNFPAYDQVLVLVNTPYYGGSGGAYATASTNPDSRDVAIHEMGHSLVGLSDEYWAGDIYAGEAINMTQETDPDQVKWKNWMGYNDVGIYQHCCGGSSASWYKPHENCKMQVLNSPFCPVCLEGTIEKIHSLTDPVMAYSPSELTLNTKACSVEFSVDMVEPEPNTLKITWMVNGVELGSNSATLKIGTDALIKGENIITLVVEDTTEMLRIDDHENIHVSSLTWNLMNNALVYNETAAICDGDSIYLQGMFQTSEGFYYDTLTSASGCDSIIVTNLVVNQVDASISSAGESIVANAMDGTFQWFDCSDFSIIEGATNQTFTPGENGDYAVAVTRNGCTDTSSCYTVATNGIPEIIGEHSFTVFPNPAKDRIELNLGPELAFQDYSVKIVSPSGHIVYFHSMDSPKMSVNLSEIGKNGLYYIQLVDAQGAITGVRKVVLNR